MRHEDEGGMRASRLQEEVEDPRSSGGVKRTGGLICEDEPRLLGESTRDGHSLPLTTGESPRAGAEPVREPHRLKRLSGKPSGVSGVMTREYEPVLDVLQRGEVGEQPEVLEHETDGSRAKAGALGLGGVGCLHPYERVAAAVEGVEQRESREQGGLPSPGPAHDCQRLPRVHVEVEALEELDAMTRRPGLIEAVSQAASSGDHLMSSKSDGSG